MNLARPAAAPCCCRPPPAPASWPAGLAWAQDDAVPPKLDVPFVPTPQEVVDRMLALAKVGKSDTLYDLGCGDGRIVVTAARQFGAHGVGIDLNPERIAEAEANAKKAGVEKRVSLQGGGPVRDRPVAGLGGQPVKNQHKIDRIHVFALHCWFYLSTG
jgi:SAM-dependent methyltransferase